MLIFTYIRREIEMMDRKKIEDFVVSTMLEYEHFHTREVIKLIAHTKQYKWSISSIIHNAVYAFTGEFKLHEYDDIIDYYINKLYS